MSVRFKGDPLPAAIGATVYADPAINQAVQRVRSGQLDKTTFSRLYSGPVRASMMSAQSKHAPAHGFGKTTETDQLRSLMNLKKIGSLAKQASVLGAWQPDVSTHAMSYNPEGHYRQWESYRKSKASEKPTGYGKSLAAGAAVGGVLGKLTGARHGGKIGLGLGGLAGLAASAMDRSNIEHSKRVLKLKPKERKRQHATEQVSRLEAKDSRKEFEGANRHTQLLRATSRR